ncbi:hypothetical protein JZ751_010891 [Albula glossodonta]|uniref:Uncharacterized protein n=1 Tax=Albula glossodonta TaxID=121402 RepID=A0A8T2P3M4_9TELE|nr:hypothetical protein JZ751_010891 [Albula glossodonta]
MGRGHSAKTDRNNLRQASLDLLDSIFPRPTAGGGDPRRTLDLCDQACKGRCCCSTVNGRTCQELRSPTADAIRGAVSTIPTTQVLAKIEQTAHGRESNRRPPEHGGVTMVVAPLATYHPGDNIDISTGAAGHGPVDRQIQARAGRLVPESCLSKSGSAAGIKRSNEVPREIMTSKQTESHQGASDQ